VRKVLRELRVEELPNDYIEANLTESLEEIHLHIETPKYENQRGKVKHQ